MGSMQAIIIALHDNRYLRQLTHPGVVGQLPISKEYTILSLLLKNFAEAGVTKPIVVCRPHQSEEIKRCLPPDTNCDIIEVRGKATIAECLLDCCDKIVGAYGGRYICVTYDDFVITKNVIKDLFKKLCRNDSYFGAVISPFSRDSAFRDHPTDVIMLDKDDNLAHYVANAKKQIEVPQSLKQKELTIRSDLHDSGFYLITGLCYKMLEDNNRNNEPKQFFTDIVNKLQYTPVEYTIVDLTRNAPPNFKLPDVMVKCMQELCPDRFEKQYCRASALIVEDAVICRRIESFQSYLDAVKQIRAAGKREQKPQEKKKPKDSGNEDAKTATIFDSDIGDDCAIASSADIRSSFIGRNCTIGENVRVHGCVVLAGTTILSDTRLTNCLVGEEAKIGMNCNLTSTSVARDHKVSSNTTLENDLVGFSEIDFDELVL
ncbi:unnamed protein product [Rodentolepis nana]|uniref:Translation initiation factor eIF2B subunit gamma n=1 Tax=Rodentolepis nana TaxID=102285 RepID=A0A0R3TBW5_RODNA|nr:unnamed protein product [Rodentolepis nana]